MTKTLESNDYWEMDKLNSEQAELVLPELMASFGVSAQELLDFAYNLKTVKTHGWGHVQIVVANGQVQRIEAMNRTLRAVETQEKG